MQTISDLYTDAKRLWEHESDKESGYSMLYLKHDSQELRNAKECI